MLLFKLMFSKRVNIPIAAINMNTDNPSISKGKQTDSQQSSSVTYKGKTK